MSRDFAATLQRGLLGESLISRWLIRRGCVVVPAYSVEVGTGKGPRVFAPQGPLVAPDLAVFKAGRVSWIEAKHKTAFSWRRSHPGPRWETGIDLPHWLDYGRVAGATHTPLWLLFLHRDASPCSCDSRHVDGGARSPVGLFGISVGLASRRARIDKRPQPHARRGMAYWGVDDLTLLADIAEVV